MIQILITGGTFDKSYNHISGDLFFEKTHIPEMLERSKCRLNVDVKTLMMIDSLEMTKKDIEKIIDECKKTKSSRIVITHGTDTMVQTAQTIKEHTSSHDKVVVITGAMLPFSIKESDAMFNFGGALIAAQTSEPGIWISMNGRIFRSDDVAKNKRKGIFEKV